MIEGARSMGTLFPLFTAMLLHVALLFAWGSALAAGPNASATKPAQAHACVCIAQVFPIDVDLQ